MTGFLRILMPPSVVKAATPTDDSMSADSLTRFLQEQLPSRHAQFAAAYATAAQNVLGVIASLAVTARDFALLHAGVIDRESFTKTGAWALRPKGPEGTGDPAPRWIPSDPLPDWVTDLNLATGQLQYDENNPQLTQIEINPPTWAGAQYPGWGYGLGQIDFVTWKDWLASNDWKDPFVNLPKSAEILAEYASQLGSLRYGVAAYNTRFDLVRDAQSKGTDPDVYTTGGDYSRDVIARATKFGFMGTAV